LFSTNSEGSAHAVFLWYFTDAVVMSERTGSLQPELVSEVSSRSSS